MRYYEPRQTHGIIQSIQRRLTAKERDFWWRLTHKTIQTRKRESKWKKDKNGMAIENTYPICNEEEESWEHYEYDCKGVTDMNKKVA